jgi:hypothetical protein
MTLTGQNEQQIILPGLPVRIMDHAITTFILPDIIMGPQPQAYRDIIRFECDGSRGSEQFNPVSVPNNVSLATFGNGKRIRGNFNAGVIPADASVSIGIFDAENDITKSILGLTPMYEITSEVFPIQIDYVFNASIIIVGIRWNTGGASILSDGTLYLNVQPED